MADLTTLLSKFLNSLYGGTLYSNPFGATSVGMPVIQAYGRSTAQTGAVASVTTYTPTADGTFEVNGNVICTTATTYAFALQVTYTDEGNTGRTVSLPVVTPSAAFGPGNTALIVNTTAGPYLGIPTHIRVKGGTAITILTTGTFTTVTYNVEGVIKQVA